MDKVILGLYGFFLLFILFYSISQLHLVILYLRRKKSEEFEKLDHEPLVTIQLPIFNEQYVAKRLIENIVKIEYPSDKLEIQILDDSTDETVEIVRKEVELWASKGFDIKHVTRTNRQGYKAGALAEGMEKAKGEFIAIFDADFLPNTDFLKQTIPHFSNENIGVVQTKWEHLNRNYSPLTKMQAFGLDAHFTVEQSGRNTGNHFINFNGTAGVWRKSCIENSGGWQSDTLTEDLDLSYRAQMKGWKFVYLQNVGTPAELPAAMNALKTQQFRWTKGAAETSRKNLWTFLTTKGLGFSTKFHGTFHLMNSFVFICIFSTALLSVPVLIIKHQTDDYQWLYNAASILILSLFNLGLYYWMANSGKHQSKWKAFWEYIGLFPLFLSVSMGLSLHNAIAVIEGYIGRKTPFVRTPKFNIKNADDKWEGKKYIKSSFGILSILEGLMCLYAISGIISGFFLKDFGLLPFHSMLAVGFGYVCFYSIKHNLPANSNK